MKRLLSCLLMLSLLACDSERTNRNPFLQEVSFRFDINLNLPLYSPLATTGNAVYIGAQGVGTRGVFVLNSGNGQFLAWEASCPNHAPNDCSTMQLNSPVVTCSCEDYSYNLFNGQQQNRPDDGQRYYDLLFYRASQSGNVVVISN
ncbi:Rieske (2Fe-2S) protein [Costertonia aggregata]|uniref:Rieske domain-containing protein n=1 Tax=Costertonia aggregata TaxID=343403 RepID=A0A7H9AQX5_9FLAO|nr:hypothetical protein [Costertonia aggregata]QLG45645.1 hypothetical protein HYG79_09900 [Costertonia aggregata]